jgi:hypothetical protein
MREFAAPKDDRSATDLGTKIAAAVSLGAAVALAVVLNILAGRHYQRWDLTKGGDFTLSVGTVETLRKLDSEVLVFVLLSRSDPTGISVAELLDGYRVHTKNLTVEFIDPDRDQDRLFEVKKQYGLLGTEVGGRVAVDAALVVVKGAHHRYVLESDLYKVEDSEDMRVRPRLEYAITSAIRQVRAEKRPTICFTTGHGELPLEAGGLEGMAEIRNRLITNNYDVRAVFDPADTNPNPLGACSLLVVAAPRAPVPPEKVAAMRSFVEGGGDALVVVWPVPDPARKGWVSLGLGDLIALAGVRVRDDLVIEVEPSLRGARGDGTIFFANPASHPVTDRLVAEQQKGIVASLAFASSLEDLGGSLKPEPLLRTSSKAFGVSDYWSRTVAESELVATEQDTRGPLTLAVATERPPVAGQTRGSRMIVVSSATPLWGATLTSPELYGSSLFTDGAVAWLAGHEQFLDLPDKPVKTTGLKLTQEGMTSTFRYVVVLIPLLTALSGVVIFWRRRVRKPVRSTS